MSWNTLRPVILAKLQTISGLGQVDDKYHSNITSFPAVQFEPSADPSVFFSNNENLHNYTFDIYVIQEMESATVGRDEAIRILGVAVDSVTNALDSYQTLGGNVEQVEAAPAEWGEVSIATGVAKYARITLRCWKLKTVT